jgi:hypothetical protein
MIKNHILKILLEDMIKDKGVGLEQYFRTMRNRLLIKLALWLLSKIDKEKIEFKNSWEHYKNAISDFLD